jgi:hypothetical protein
MKHDPANNLAVNQHNVIVFAPIRADVMGAGSFSNERIHVNRQNGMADFWGYLLPVKTLR